ncbi:hypothetical protein RF11_10289 [Thelohanellus kitauei]|uniref:Uncharacterized protein n=1 Tax=Thelohanellus kitauei TaxID=669202 RepID=A0A0C2MKA3_THEKT|nr:hypothetical protein RF11_10289 [Thelohanellus kitauei]
MFKYIIIVNFLVLPIIKTKNVEKCKNKEYEILDHILNFFDNIGINYCSQNFRFDTLFKYNDEIQNSTSLTFKCSIDNSEQFIETYFKSDSYPKNLVEELLNELEHDLLDKVLDWDICLPNPKISHLGLMNFEHTVKNLVNGFDLKAIVPIKCFLIKQTREYNEALHITADESRRLVDYINHERTKIIILNDNLHRRMSDFVRNKPELRKWSTNIYLMTVLSCYVDNIENTEKINDIIQKADRFRSITRYKTNTFDAKILRCVGFVIVLLIVVVSVKKLRIRMR